MQPLGVCVVEPQPTRRFYRAGRPAGRIGLPGATVRKDRKDRVAEKYELNTCRAVDGDGTTTNAYLATYHSLPDLQLAWQQRAQGLGAFARNPVLRELVNVPSLVSLVRAGEPGAVDLTLQVLCREGASGEPQRLVSLPHKDQRAVALEALLQEEARIAAVPAAAVVPAAAAAAHPSGPMPLLARAQQYGVRRTIFLLRWRQPLGLPFFGRHHYGGDTEQVLNYCSNQLCGAQRLIGGHCGAMQTADLQQQLEACIQAEAAEVPQWRADTPGPHMLPLPLPQRSLLPTQPLFNEPLHVEHALSQLVCYPDQFHALQHIGALPGYLNTVKGAGQWLTLELALQMYPEIVQPALQHDGWLDRHLGELSDWMVHQSGTVVPRFKWQQGSSPEVFFARRYSEVYWQYRSSHPEQPCACERCGGTLAARGERLLAQLHQALMLRLRQQAPLGARTLDFMRHGPQAFRIDAGIDAGSVRLRLVAASCRTRLRRSDSVASPEQQQLAAEEALLEQEAHEQALADAEREEGEAAAAAAAATPMAAAAQEAARDGGRLQLDAAQHSLGGHPANLVGLTRFLVSAVHDFLRDKCGISRSMPRVLPLMLQHGIAAFLRPNDHLLLPTLEAESRTAAADFLAQHAQQQQQVAQQQIVQQPAGQQQPGQKASADEGQQHKKARLDGSQQEEWLEQLIQQTTRQLDKAFTKQMQRMRQQGWSEQEVRKQTGHWFGAGTM